MIFGMDYLGGAMFGSVLLRSHPKGFAAGFFADTFGNCWGVVDKLAASGKCPLIRIHGPWTAHRYIPPEHDKAIFAALKKTVGLQERYPEVKFQFSPVCESDGRGPSWRALFSNLKQVAGAVELVCSVYKGEVIQGYRVEVHGSHKPHTGAKEGYQYSYDGTNATDSNVEKDKETHKNAEVFFFWHPAFNLKYKTQLSGHETPKVKKNDSALPRARNCLPTPELIKSLEVLAQPKGFTQLARQNIWKSHADRHESPPEPRAYKPVLISPVRGKVAYLVDSNNVAVFKSSGPVTQYQDGKRWVYRFSDFGYDIALKPLTLMVGGKRLGLVNPAFREGEYRS